VAFQNIEQAHQAGAVQAHTLGQFLLRDAIAPGAQVDQRRPGGVGQAVGQQLFLDLAAPLAYQGDHEKAETGAGRGRGKGHASIIFVVQLICIAN